MSDSSANASSVDEPIGDSCDRLDRIATEFAARIASGEPPNIDEYVALYPELADDLHDLLYAVEHLEEAGRERAASEDGHRAFVTTSIERLGDYRIVREVGRGGMAVVYEATDASLGRRVALKVLPYHLTSSVRFRERFQREVLAAASLEHPHIVPVFGAGRAGDVHYYAMQFIDGEGLDARLAADQEDPSRQPNDDDYRAVASIGLQVAEALAHAHERGVLHRDIKPSNILVDRSGHAWVTDFGLCKTRSESDLTMSGDIIGTLRYMPPESFGGEVDARADIYGLGVTLYEMLAREPAVRGDRKAAIVRQITEENPKSLRSIDPAIPRDLETIVLEATSKLPSARYSSAMDMARDLRAFLDARPIVARRPTLAYLLYLAARRNKMLTATLATAITVLMVATGLYITHIRDALDARDRSLLRTRAIGLASASAEVLDTDPMLSTLLARDAVRLRESPETVSRLARALSALREEGVIAEHASRILGIGFVESDRVWSCFEDELRIDRIGHDGDGSAESVCFFVGESPIISVAASTDGEKLVTLDLAGRLCRYRDDGWQRAIESDRVYCAVAISPTGAWLVAADEVGGLDVFDFDSAHRLSLAGLGVPASVLEVSHDGERFVATSARGPTAIWQHDGVCLSRFEVPPSRHRRCVLNCDGSELLISGDRTFSRYNATGELLAEFIGHEGQVTSMAFSPDGSLVVSGSKDQSARLWDSDGHERSNFRVRTGGTVFEAEFAPDGQAILTGSADQSAALWDLHSRPLDRFVGHESSVEQVAISSDGQRVITASADRTVRSWRVVSRDFPVFLGHEQGLYTAEFSADGTRVVTGSRDNSARVWELSGRLLARYDHDAFVCSADFLESGGLLTTVAFSGCHIWTPERDDIRIDTPASARVMAFHEWRRTDGTVGGVDLVVRRPPHSAEIVRYRRNASDGYELSDAQPVVLNGHDDLVWAARFDTDGERLLTASSDGTAILWDRDGRQLARLVGHGDLVRSASFSPDGRSIVTASDDGSARLWSSSGEPETVIRGHEGPVLQAAFSPDGRRVVTASRDRTAMLWDLHGRLITVFAGHTGVVWSARFSPDGTRVLTASLDGTARLWLVGTESLLECAERSVFRDYTPTERERYRELLAH